VVLKVDENNQHENYPRISKMGWQNDSGWQNFHKFGQEKGAYLLHENFWPKLHENLHKYCETMSSTIDIRI
jgi:hypothetical protein